jgi:cytochrome c5
LDVKQNGRNGVLAMVGGCGLAAAGLGGGCEKGPAAPVTPPKPAATAWVQPLALGPITYFNTQCSTCHGKYGVQIADHNIAKNSSAEDYRAMVEYMVTVRAESSLPPREMDAQTAYCASLAAGGEGVLSEGAPTFVCIKTPVNEGGLEGEVTPGSTVTLVAAKGQVRIDAEVDGHNWSISPQRIAGAKSSAGDDWVNAVIEARPKSGGAVQKLKLSEEAFKGPTLKK